MSEEKVEKALNFIRDQAANYAEAKAERVYLMEFRKSKKAILMSEAEKNGTKTAAAQEREAYANPEYLQLLDGLKIAVENEEKIKWLLTVAQLKFEKWRTLEASRRQEHRNYGN